MPLFLIQNFAYVLKRLAISYYPSDYSCLKQDYSIECFNILKYVRKEKRREIRIYHTEVEKRNNAAAERRVTPCKPDNSYSTQR